jgi:hypothetical protein
VGDARLHARDEVVRTDLHHPVEAAQIEAYAAAEGYGVPLEAAPLPVRDYRDTPVAGEAEHRGDLVSALRVDYRVGVAGCMIGEDRLAVPGHLSPFPDYAARREDLPELG